MEQPPASRVPVASTTTTPPSGIVLMLEAPTGHDAGEQVGSQPMRLGVSTVDGGRLESGSGFRGVRAYRFPRYVASGRYPRAVVTVTSAGAVDALSPGPRRFSWGADFKLDAVSEGRSTDNGNNLLQRGLFSEPALYKAELDDRRPACAVRGRGGVVVARSPRRVTPGTWYHLECQRDGDYLTVVTYRLENDGKRDAVVQVGTIGSVDMPSQAIPLSVGGKVAPNGVIIGAATDQFNGEIAHPFVRLGSTS